MNIVEAPLRRLGDTPIFLSNYLCTYEFAGWRRPPEVQDQQKVAQEVWQHP